jgi:putative transposase
MPWMQTCPMSQKRKFIDSWMADEAPPVRRLATIFGISSKTAHKWIARYRARGYEGLDELKRGPRDPYNETPEDIQQLIIEIRRDKRYWGPRKLKAALQERWPELHLPATSTIAEIIRKAGLVKVRSPRRKPAKPSATPNVDARQPNDVWSTDFKGWFRTKDGQRVDPLTITDNYSRFLLKCDGLIGAGFEQVRPSFEATFREFGLPAAIRSDNGVPFASTALGGISALSAWFIRLGIKPQRIAPGKPQQNGRHERMHRTLKQQTAKPSAATITAQQEAFDAFRREYNEERPHEAIGMAPPSRLYRPSPRAYFERKPDDLYGSDHEVRTVRSNGEIKFRNDLHFVSAVLKGEKIGLLPMADGIWSIEYCDYRLGYFDARTNGITARMPERRPDQATKVSPKFPV